MKIEICREAYSQVYSIINYLGDEYKNKIPNNLLEFFSREKDTVSGSEFNPYIQIEEQGLLKDTISILAMLKLQYWCESEEEKQKLLNQLSKNEIEYQDNLRKKYNPDNLFKNNIQNEDIISENQIKKQMIQHKETVFTKIKKWLKRNNKIKGSLFKLCLFIFSYLNLSFNINPIPRLINPNITI